IVGYALYIDPPLGRIGMTDSQARAGGRQLLGAQRPMSRVGRAIEKGETQGFMKIVVDAETRKILGAAILGTGGDEAIHGIIDMMNVDTTLTGLTFMPGDGRIPGLKFPEREMPTQMAVQGAVARISREPSLANGRNRR